MHVLGFIVFGLIVGLLARAIFPGAQPMGWVATAILGMVGSLVGGLVGNALWGGSGSSDTVFGLTPGGLISSLIGAIVVLWAYLGMAGRRTTV